MLVQTHFPRKLSRVRYDQYLASGWFRGAVMLYKMDLLCIDDALFSVVNIRVQLDDFIFRKSQRKLLRKVDARFRTVFGEANPTKDKEALYTAHKHRFKGFIHATLAEYLKAGFDTTVFDTREVCIYDEDKLIAVSYFDMGEKSMASLLGLYDERYSEWSLGKATMLKEIEFGIKNERKWYYPGYILDRDSSFDYKLELGTTEFYTPDNSWAGFSKHDPTKTHGYAIRLNTDKLCNALTNLGIPHKPWLYPYFSMGHLGPWNAYLMSDPAPVELGYDLEGMMVATYSSIEKAYSLFSINPCPEGSHLLNLEASDEFSNSTAYLNHLYQTGDFILIHGTLEILMELIKVWKSNPHYIPPS